MYIIKAVFTLIINIYFNMNHKKYTNIIQCKHLLY